MTPDAKSRRGQKPGVPIPTASVWRPKFLEAFRVSMNWSASARAAGVSRQAAKQAYANAADFRAAVDEAEQEAIDSLELTLLERAQKGLSDRALEFALRAHRPVKYDPMHRVEISGPNGGPINLDLASNLAARLDRLAARVESEAEPDSGDDPGDAPPLDPDPLA